MQSDIVDSGNKVVASAYRAMAAQMSTAEGIEYRYGPNAAAYGNTGTAGRPTLTVRTDQSYDPVANRNGGSRGCDPVAKFCGTWQIGGPLVQDGGDYSSSILHSSFVADDASKNVGVTTLQSINMAHNTFALKPEPSWTTYASATLNGGVNDLSALDYQKAGQSAKNPVAVGRCYRTGWCTNSLMVFQSGLIGTTGSNTSSNKATAQLAPGKVPTAIAITGSNEFALITVWDTVNLRGQVAVVALAGLCESCTPSQPARQGGLDWGEWNAVYPGLMNMGDTAYMKVLGYIDLPDTMTAPTEISVSTGMDFEGYRTFDPAGAEGGTRLSPSQLPLTEDANRKSFYNGSNRNSFARAGMAVVISKSERRAAFIDLRPLLGYYKEKYFGGTQAAFNSLMAGRGEGANQWPYTFDADASQKPVIRKVEDFGDDKPTAVNVRQNGAARAFIATQKGQMQIYDLGNYLNAAAGAAPEQIVRKGAVAVGRNPTHIAYVKPHGYGSDQRKVYTQGYDREVIVTSRGDRKIDWVQFSADFNSGAVRPNFSLADSQLVDPISADDVENHGTESYVLSVADYGGRKVSNYRYGPVVFWTNVGSGWTCQPPAGCATNGTFEYGGSYAVPGRPFQVVGSNIP
ncbi:hypothetical protein [Variovorax boronicumulans]|uniref:hypothetical protein n=1 Tax=Variovorax boronicumulans TaxID=436515 RepID=UPI001C58EE07